MKIIKTANGNQIKLSKNEWQSIGKTAGWGKDIADAAGENDIDKAIKTITETIEEDDPLYQIYQAVISDLHKKSSLANQRKEQQSQELDEKNTRARMEYTVIEIDTILDRMINYDGFPADEEEIMSHLESEGQVDSEKYPDLYGQVQGEVIRFLEEQKEQNA